MKTAEVVQSLKEHIENAIVEEIDFMGEVNLEVQRKA